MRATVNLNIDNTYRSANLNAKYDYWNDPNKAVKLNYLNPDDIQHGINEIDESKRLAGFELQHKISETKEKLQRTSKATIRRELNEKLCHLKLQERWYDYDQRHYIMQHGPGEDQTTLQQFFKMGLPITYTTTDVIPFPVLLKLHENPGSEAVYILNGDFGDRETTNIRRSSMLCRTTVKVPVGLVDPTNEAAVYEILFKLWRVRYLIDRVDIQVAELSKQEYDSLAEGFQHNYVRNGNTYHVNPEVLYKTYFEPLHEVLARWRMQLFFLLPSASDAKEMYSMGISQGLVSID